MNPVRAPGGDLDPGREATEKPPTILGCGKGLTVRNDLSPPPVGERGWKVLEIAMSPGQPGPPSTPHQTSMATSGSNSDSERASACVPCYDDTQVICGARTPRQIIHKVQSRPAASPSRPALAAHAALSCLNRRRIGKGPDESTDGLPETAPSPASLLFHSRTFHP